MTLSYDDILSDYLKLSACNIVNSFCAIQLILATFSIVTPDII